MKFFLAFLAALFFSGAALADGHDNPPPDNPCGAEVKFFDYSNNERYERDAKKWCDGITYLFGVDRKFCTVKYNEKDYYYFGYFEWNKRFEGYDAYDVYSKIGDRHLGYVYKGENFRTHIWWDRNCKY